MSENIVRITRPKYGRRIRPIERGHSTRVKVNHRAGVEFVR